MKLKLIFLVIKLKELIEKVTRQQSMKYEVIIIMKRNFERMKEKEGRISNIKF